MSIIFPPVVDTYQQGYMTTRPNDLPTYTGEDLVLTYRDPNEQGQRLVELSIRDQYTNHSIFSNRRETAIVSGLLLAPYEDFAISTTKTTLNCKFEQRADNPTLIRFQKVDNGTKVETLPKGYNNYLKLGSISFTPGATYRFSIKDETGDTLETLPVSLWIYDNNDRECEFAAGQEITWPTGDDNVFPLGGEIYLIVKEDEAAFSTSWTGWFTICFEKVVDSVVTTPSTSVTLPSEIGGWGLTAGLWYKVQLRFLYFDSTLQSYRRSEWSTISLIKAFSYFQVTFTSPEPGMTVLTAPKLTVSGQMQLQNSQENERIAQYEIAVIRSTRGSTAPSVVIEKSGVQYPSSAMAQQFGPYTLKTNFQESEDAEYEIRVTYLTTGQYTETISSGFFSVDHQIFALQGDLYVSSVGSKGYNEIQLGLTEEDIANNRFFSIHRSSYKDNYSARETVFVIDLDTYKNSYPLVSLLLPNAVGNPNSLMDCLAGQNKEANNGKEYVFAQVFADTTAEPGVLYHYGLSKSTGHDYEYDDLKGGKTSVSECMLDTEEVFLIDKNAAICLNANVNINEFKYVVQESLTNTLGSQYPFIRRNGNTKYRQFTITGTICGQGDTEGLLLSRDNAWGIIANSFYADYALKHHIAPWNNYLFEKVYRDTAIAFLMNGKPKIFKSLTEGNMIVQLSNVSFTPNVTVGRMIYDFSATVTEIAADTVSNHQKYGCYITNGSDQVSASEYYLVVDQLLDEGTGYTAAQTGDNIYELAAEGYLCLQEVQTLLSPYMRSQNIDDILANDSMQRGDK